MLEIENLYKTYKNGKEALKDVSLSIETGEFTAILGPNGAGKTTLINILAGNVIKTSGKVNVAGIDIDKNALNIKKKIGIVPQEIGFDGFFTVNEVLQNQSGYFGLKNNQVYIDELLDALALGNKKNSGTRALSGGMKRRLLIAKALVHKPKFFILDEPTAGVDIELRQHLYSYLKKLHKFGTTIILTTHYLEEAEELCKRILILNHGKIIADDTSQNLIKKLGFTTRLEFTFAKLIKPKDLEFLNRFQPEILDNKLVLRAKSEDLTEVFSLLNSHNYKYQNVKIQEPKLENVFLRLTNS